MRTVIFRSIPYPVAAISNIYLAALHKFMLAVNIDSSIVLTEELDRSAARYLRLMVPGFPPELATEDGIREMEFEDFVALLADLSEIHLGDRANQTEAYMNSLIEGEG